MHSETQRAAAATAVVPSQGLFAFFNNMKIVRTLIVGFAVYQLSAFSTQSKNEEAATP